MPEMSAEKPVRARRLRHRGRSSQILIYLGKQLRFFINENDWKVLPMAAVIAALVGMVIRKRLFINMEGSLIGGFALTCVAIWNGCFNSIQSVCRERAIIKREHRSGMHITSYVCAHMIYQLMLCMAQTGLTMYVLQIIGVRFPAEGFMTPWMMLDIGISMLLISYAADMMSLFISSIAHTTTGAMTIMPFVLIFQLVFSGGVIPLPEWSQPLSNFTISSYGIRAIAAQSDYNNLPMVTAWNTLSGMRDTEIGGTFTLGQALELADKVMAEDEETADAAEGAAKADGQAAGLGQLAGLTALVGVTEGGAELDPATLRALLDYMKNSEEMQAAREETYTVRTTVGELFRIFGEDNIREMVQQKTVEASYKKEYERTPWNIAGNWIMLGLFALLFALLATLSLEMIDKDKR